MPLFLYTDIEGSTQLWERHGQVMSHVLDRHDEILLDCVEKSHGRHVKNSGDGMLAVFDDAAAMPLECALAMQRRLAAAVARQRSSFDKVFSIVREITRVAELARVWLCAHVAKVWRLRLHPNLTSISRTMLNRVLRFQ